MAAVSLEGTSAECVRTPSPRTDNGVSTGSLERQQPKADGTGSEEAGDRSELRSVGDGPIKDVEGVTNHDQEQRGREDHSKLLPNGIHSTVSEVQAGDAGCGGPPASGVQLRHNSGRTRPMSFLLQSHHGLLLKEEMAVEGERMAVWLGEESIVWEGGRTGKGLCGHAVMCCSMTRVGGSNCVCVFCWLECNWAHVGGCPCINGAQTVQNWRGLFSSGCI